MHFLGFFVTRHVNSAETNLYWKECVKNIRIHHPYNTIVIIDDQSDYSFIECCADDLKNCIVVQSQFPGRGELLPYYYWALCDFGFKRAVILHDSVFLQQPLEIPSDFKNVLFLWDFYHNWNRPEQETSLIGTLTNSGPLLEIYQKEQHLWRGCMGAMSVIDRSFLLHLWKKFDMHLLLSQVTCRGDRSCFERLFSVICFQENGRNHNSLLGNIHEYVNWQWGKTFQTYLEEKANNVPQKPVVKVWTGR